MGKAVSSSKTISADVRTIIYQPDSLASVGEVARSATDFLRLEGSGYAARDPGAR